MNTPMNGRPIGPTKREPYHVDPAREHLEETTMILVRAVNSQGEWGAHDINTLTKASLIDWLRDHDRPVSERLICLMLGHQP